MDALLTAGIARVVAGAADPNPKTAGRAAKRFADAGVAYEIGVLREECEALIARYANHRTRGLPWTIAKWAMSADGRLADGSRRARWITGTAARELVHELRGRVEAIVVGRGTVEADDPALTCRLPGGGSPTRIVLDSGLATPLSTRVVATARATPTLFLCAPRVRPERREAFRALGVEVVEAPADASGRVSPESAFRTLYGRGVRRVLLEGGGQLLGSCMRAGLVHQVMAFTAPVLLGGDRAPRPMEGPGWRIGHAPRLEEPRVTPV